MTFDDPTLSLPPLPTHPSLPAILPHLPPLLHLSDTLSCGVLEPYGRRIPLLSGVIQLLYSIVRVNEVVKIKRISLLSSRHTASSPFAARSKSNQRIVSNAWEEEADISDEGESEEDLEQSDRSDSE